MTNISSQRRFVVGHNKDGMAAKNKQLYDHLSDLWLTASLVTALRFVYHIQPVAQGYVCIYTLLVYVIHYSMLVISFILPFRPCSLFQHKSAEFIVSYFESHHLCISSRHFFQHTSTRIY